MWLIGGSGTLAVGDSTVLDTLQFNVQSPVTQTRFSFVASATTPPTFTVPALPPDSIPSWVLADTSIDNNRYTKRVIDVLFKSTATQADRQAAIDLVGGTIIGGLPDETGDGYYIVQIADDGSGAQLDAAITQLVALPTVDLATRQWRGTGPSYLRPIDGQSWKKSDWELNPDNAIGDNWGFEAIAATMAWGCNTGDPSVQIAVLDHAYDATEISSNIAYGANQLGRFPTETLRHGTEVTNVLAATGNDASGMTGLMWHAGLRIVDFGTPNPTPEQIGNEIKKAGAAGTTIVNLSYAWLIPWGSYTPTGSPQDTAFVWKNLKPMIRQLRKAQQNGKLPLMVIGAGNAAGADAFLSGYPALRDSFPSNVIVVGASTRSPRTRWSGSSTGPHLDVYAPGYLVTSYGALGFGPFYTGTSFATPLVAGVAGLLESLDPQLTAAQLQQLILSGAQQGARRIVRTLGTADSAPLLNAYESLKLAAQSSGAALCGNRIWSENNGVVKVQRTTTTTEQIFNAGTPVWALTPMHGGRRIEYMTSAGKNVLLYNAASRSWQTAPVQTYPDSIPAGASNSIIAKSHDGDRTAILNLPPPIPPNSSGQLGISLRDSAGTITALASITVATPPAGVGSLCRMLGAGGTCLEGYSWIGMQEYQSYHVAFPPQGRKILVTVNHLIYSITPDSVWYPCNWPVGDSVAVSCRAANWDFHATHTNIYSVDTLTHAVAPIDSVPGKAIFWLGMSESDSTMVVGIGGRSQSFNDDPISGNSPIVYTTPGCAVEYRTQPFGTTVLQSISTNDACHFVNYNTDDHSGGGGIAASASVSGAVPQPTPVVRALFP